MELATALASRQIITCPPPGHPTQVVTQLEDEAPVVVTCLCTCGLAQQTPSQQAPLPGTTPPVTQVTPRRLVFNTTSGVDAPTVGEEDYPPGVGPVDLTADACPLRRLLPLGQESWMFSSILSLTFHA